MPRVKLHRMVVSIEGPIVSAQNVDRLEALWRGLHLRHIAVASYRELVTDEDASWRRRRAWYLDLLADGGCYYLAQDASTPVGYAFLRIHPGPDDTFDAPKGVLEIVSLAVSPDHQRRGIGTMLMQAVAGEARTRGIDTLQVAVMAGNDDAEAFYRRTGFSLGEKVFYRK